MFPKAILIFLAIGALSVNALTTPVARSPAPELERELLRSSSTVSHYDLTSPVLEARQDPRKDIFEPRVKKTATIYETLSGSTGKGR